MRIVAGQFRGRRLRTPSGLKIRPTTDRVREAIFSILLARIPGAAVLDLYAGSGAMGLEALSRGARSAVFVDQSVDAVRLIRENIELCRAGDRSDVLAMPAQQAIRRLAASGRRFGIVFMDPPYGEGKIESALPVLDEVAEPGVLVIAEHHIKDPLPEVFGSWSRTDHRKYGDTAVSFFTLNLTQ